MEGHTFNQKNNVESCIPLNAAEWIFFDIVLPLLCRQFCTVKKEGDKISDYEEKAHKDERGAKALFFSISGSRINRQLMIMIYNA